MSVDILNELYKLQDIEYADFQSSLIPGVERECFIGVRTPDLRKLAKRISTDEDVSDFLMSLPHRFFEENQLHAFIISEIKDFDECVSATEAFLPYIDNWATCDQLSPKTFKKHKTELLPYIKRWLSSDKVYTVRFGIKMLMQYFLDEDFDIEYAETVSRVESDEYYINMMIAWYFATALAKQYDAVIPFIENRALSPWTHNKAIQKSVESYRVTPEHKEYLRSLRIKIR